LSPPASQRPWVISLPFSCSLNLNPEAHICILHFKIRMKWEAATTAHPFAPLTAKVLEVTWSLLLALPWSLLQVSHQDWWVQRDMSVSLSVHWGHSDSTARFQGSKLSPVTHLGGTLTASLALP
jgi:hypothetical protein